MNKRKVWSLLAIGLCGLLTVSGKAAAKESDILALYQQYEADFAAIESLEDIEEYGYTVIDAQSFPIQLESFGEEEVMFVPIMDKAYHRQQRESSL